MMEPTFLQYDKPLLTVMLQSEEAETVSDRIAKALESGAEAFGLQVEALKPEYQTEETVTRLFGEMRGKPVYVTNYRSRFNTEKTDEELAQGILTLADRGATLCDVMGDMFCRHPEELTDEPGAVVKQMKLIDQLHSKGAQVLMSSHTYRFTPAERVLEMALEQRRRGADIVKIVTGADNMEQQLENLRITHLLKKQLDVPFLFLSVGVCSLHRRLGIKLGCCMTLCVYEHDAFTTPAQPLLSVMKQVRDQIDF